MKNYAARLSDN